MEIPVVSDAPYSLVRTPKNIQIRGVNVVPYKSATIMVCIYYEEVSSASFMEDNNKVKYLTIEMNTEKYLMWQNDDNYLVEYVLEYLGMRRA